MKQLLLLACYSSLFMLHMLQGSTYPIAQMARGK